MREVCVYSSEGRMYELLRTLCPDATVVYVAHRLYLRDYHDRELEV